MERNTVRLSQILLATIEGRATALKVSGTLFDLRSDLTIGPRTYALAVELTFFNEGWCDPGNNGTIRRRLSLTLFDAEEGGRVSGKNMKLSMPACVMYRAETACLPIKAARLSVDHDYELTVSNAQTGEVLGSRRFHLYGLGLENCYEAEEAGVTPYCGNRICSSINLSKGTCAAARFNLYYVEVDRPCKMPDVEVRLHFPDGSLTRRFCGVTCDDYDMHRYHAEAPFLITEANRGIVYAEALVDDTAFAGVVFCTGAEDCEGALSGSDIHVLDEYSPEAAAARFRRQMEADDEDDDGTDLDDEHFDHLLDEFIKSETRATEGSDDTSEEKAEDEAGGFASEMDALVGLEGVKCKLLSYEKLMRFNAMRAAAGLAVSTAPLHAMFLGSPGTGKTTVAKMVGRMLHGVGLLSKGHVVVRERATLSGTHYGDHEKLTLEAIEESRGGILFIDEAYQLFQHNDPKDPGRLVIETLLTALADEDNRDWMLILAGYPGEMRRLFDINPGLRSRIPESNIYTFDDFSDAELMEIADRWFARHDYSLTEAARTALSSRLSADCAARDKSFGNARHVVNMIQTDILPAMAVRVMDSSVPSAQSLTEILPDDIPAAAAPMASSERPRIGFVR